MVAVEYERGIHLPAAKLWLDSARRRELAFVSHAHSDHAGRHGRILCSWATARLMQTRLRVRPDMFEPQEFHERREFGAWSATLLPAGHVLGSAQIFFESDEGTLLYTGDFKWRSGCSCETAVARSAETLVMETTYGQRRYAFPPAEEVLDAIRVFCHETLAEGGTPVLQAYSLGKAQEVLCGLRDAGLHFSLHKAVCEIVRVYEEFGVRFPPWSPMAGGASSGRVVVSPPQAGGLEEIPRPRVAALTGWALDRHAIYRLGVDAAFPLSDHADYGELLQYVEAVQPARVLTLHGFAQEFARDLRALGMEAWALTGPNQLELPLP